MSRRTFTTLPSTWSTSTTVVFPSLRTTRAPRIVAGNRRAQLSGSPYRVRTRSAGAFTCSLTTASIMFDLTIRRTGPRIKAQKRKAGTNHIQPFDRDLIGAVFIFPTTRRRMNNAVLYCAFFRDGTDTNQQYQNRCAKLHNRLLTVWGRLRCCPQVEFPSLGRKILSEAVMPFFAHDLEPGLFVEVSCRMKNALRPKRHLAIPRLPCESDAFFNQPLADSQATRLRFNMQQPQPCDFVRCLRDKDSTNPCSILFRNPAAFAPRIIILDELRHDFCRQGLVCFIPTVLLGVQDSLPMDDPAQVARVVQS